VKRHAVQILENAGAVASMVVLLPQLWYVERWVRESISINFPPVLRATIYTLSAFSQSHWLSLIFWHLFHLQACSAVCPAIFFFPFRCIPSLLLVWLDEFWIFCLGYLMVLYYDYIASDDRMISESRAVGGMRIGRRNWSTQKKLALVPLCPHQVPHDLSWPGIGPGSLLVSNHLSYDMANLN
jgi:hypothetical protein